jgi:hypothetical protein
MADAGRPGPRAKRTRTLRLLARDPPDGSAALIAPARLGVLLLVPGRLRRRTRVTTTSSTLRPFTSETRIE